MTVDPLIMSAAFDQAPMSLGLVDDEGRWLRLNSTLTGILGRTEQELIGSEVAAVVHPDDRPIIAGAVGRLVAGQDGPVATEGRLLDASGRSVAAGLELQPLRVPARPGVHLLVAVAVEDRPPPALTRVLVVDDDDTTQKVAAVMLRRLGFVVEVAGSGGEALAWLGQSDFDAVLMDCSMPGLDGFATTARIRQREAGGSRTPVVAMTGSAMPGDRERCLRAGMDDYVGKPVTSTELNRVITRWAARPASRSGGAGGAESSGMDWPQLELLRQACVTDARPGVLGELVGEFLATSRDRIDRLRRAVAAGEATEAERVAHLLKGASATFGSREMAGLAADVEQAARLGSLRAAPEFLAGLSEAFDRTARALRRWMAQEASR